jgi:toxin FitB
VIVIDSSGWLEFFADGPYAADFGSRLRKPESVLTPVIALYEVYKWIKRERSEEDALQAIAAMKRTRIVPLTEEIALTAADLSLNHKLAMADAIMLAVARLNAAELWTTDADFLQLDGVTVFPKHA